MPIKIPVIEQVSESARGLPTQAPLTVAADTSYSQAANFAGQTLGHLEGEYVRRAEEARRRGDEVQVASGLAALEGVSNATFQGSTDENGKRVPGFLSTQGLAASDQSQAALEAITEARKKIAEGMANERQRAAFAQRSGQILVSADHTVQSHTSQQFKLAQKATVAALQSETLKAIENNPNDLSLPIRLAEVERTTRELQLSPEDGDADVSRFKAAAGMAEINGLLASGNIAGAKKVLEEKHDALGVMRDEAAFKIERKENAGRVQREQTENETVVGGIMGVARRPDGRIDEAKALEQLDKVPPERFTEVRRLYEARLQLEHQRNKYIDGERRKAAREQFIGGGLSAIDPQVVADLKHYDGEYYARLKHEADLQARRARAGRGGAKALATADLASYRRYLAALVEDPDTEPGEWAIGRGIGDATVANMELAHARAQKSKGKGEERGLKSFVDQVERLTPELKSKGKAKPVFSQADDREMLRGRAAEFYADWKTAHKGAEPTPAEVEQMQNELTKQVITEVPGRFWGTNEMKQPAFRVPRQSEAPRPQDAAPKSEGKIRVRLKSSGKTGFMPASKFDASTMEKL